MWCFRQTLTRNWGTLQAIIALPVAPIGDENAPLRSRPFQPGRRSAMQRNRPTFHLFGDRLANERNAWKPI